MVLFGPEKVELPSLFTKFLTPKEQKALLKKIMQRQEKEIEKILNERHEGEIVTH